MSRTSLHRPRRNRAVWDRPATGTRLFPCPFPPNVPTTLPPLQALPQGPSPTPPQRSITVPPGLRDRLWKVPGHCHGLPFSKATAKIARPSHRAQSDPPPQATSKEPSVIPGSRLRAISAPCRTTPSSLSEIPFHPATAVSHRSHHPSELKRAHHSPSPDSTVVSPRRAHAYPVTVSSPRPPYLRRVAGHFWWSRLPHTEILLASPPRPLRSTGLSQSRRLMCNIRCRGQHPSVQASPSSCATVRDLPSPPPPQPPQSREKRTFPAKQSNFTPGSAHQSKLPHSYPPKGAAQQPIPSTPPPTIK